MNHRNPAIKRILADVKELQRHPSSRYHATPLEDNMFEWHFTIRGPDDTSFAGGVYHGRILLPAEYPFKPPNIVFLTKNGRFEVGTKICLSISAYHEETWQPAWGVRTMLEAIISFLPSEGAGAIGALDWTAEERKRLAALSHSYVCPICGPIAQLLSEPSKEGEDEKPDSTIQEQVAQLHLGPPPRSDSVKHTLTTAATDLLLSSAVTSPIAAPIDTAPAFTPPTDLAGNSTLEETITREVENTTVTELHDTAVTEMVVEESADMVGELSEDALDNFESMQEIEELKEGLRLRHPPHHVKKKEEGGEEVEGEGKKPQFSDVAVDPQQPAPATNHNNNNNRQNNNNQPQPQPHIHHFPPPAAARPPRPAVHQGDAVEQFRRIEEFLNTIILITIVGIIAILIRVFIRNFLHVDF